MKRSISITQPIKIWSAADYDVFQGREKKEKEGIVGVGFNTAQYELYFTGRNYQLCHWIEGVFGEGFAIITYDHEPSYSRIAKDIKRYYELENRQPWNLKNVKLYAKHG